jgi:hypothetical protein
MIYDIAMEKVALPTGRRPEVVIMIAHSEAFIWDNTTAEQTVEGIKLTACVDAASSFDGGLEARGAHRHVP